MASTPDSGKQEHPEKGLTDTQAVEAMTGMILAITPQPHAEPAP
jgi:hypothetical protein